jgi:hypothetical protein
LPVFAQKYGAEWIRYDQKYYKFPIYYEGVYRIDSTTLSKYFDLSTVNPKNFQLFLKGRELRIYITGEADNKVNTSDYLEFYVNPLPGEIDSLIYKKGITYLQNPYRPLFSDTAYAFLTLGNSTTNLRYTLSTDTASAGANVATYMYTEKVATSFLSNGGYSDNGYNLDDLYNLEVSDPNYTQVEGKGAYFVDGVTARTNMSLFTYTNSPTLPFYITLNMSGALRKDGYVPDHRSKFTCSDQNNNDLVLMDTSYFGYAAIRRLYSIPVGSLSPNTNFSITAIAVPNFTFTQFTMVHYLRIFYPQILNFIGQSFHNLTATIGGSGNRTFYNFANMYNPTGLPPILYDASNGNRITTVINGNNIRAVYPISANDAHGFICGEHAVFKITNLKPVNGTGSFTRYLPASSNEPYVIIYHPSLKTSATTYANYRKSAAGGSHEVVLADILQLYDQYAYGAIKHPLSIRNFVKYLKDSLANAPSSIFLIGKGIQLLDINIFKQDENLIPTMGVPSSDHLLTAALTTTDTFYPEIPIGRLTALTDQEVLDYLDKVQAIEAAGNSEWKKNILHFVGGDDEALNARLKMYMENYSSVIRDTLFGGLVHTFMKNTTAPIQTQISDSIRLSINQGASLFNFFGHGSEQGFDQAIDDPEKYENTGRYPFVIANSCYSGNIFKHNNTSVSDRFVKSKKKGSIGFIATSSYGFDSGLDNFTSGFYKAIARTHYGRPIGEVIKEAARLNSLAGDLLTPIVGLEMCLHGDPAIIISVGDLPDYQTANNQVRFDLKKYTDSIGVQVAIKNPGKALHDSLGIRLTRIFPNNDSIVIFRNMIAPAYKDTFRINLFLDFDRGIGLNKFRVAIDYNRRITETDETNNSTTGSVDFFVPGGDILPVYPYKYAIVEKSNNIVLKASTSDPFAPVTKYILQLDTSDAFTNPISQTNITSKGGVMEWLVNLPFADSTVYFWRVSRDSISPEKPFTWKESSFQTLSNKRGWGQSQFQQFKNDGYQFVTYKNGARKFVFQNTRYSVNTRVGIVPYISMEYINSYYNNLILDQWSTIFDGWNFAVFDSASGKPWKAFRKNLAYPGAGQYNNCVGNDSIRQVFAFGRTTGDCAGQATWQQDVENFINQIPKNAYVLGYATPYTFPYSNYSSYSNNLYKAFESLGLAKIRTTKDTVAYTFFGKKGMSIGQANEVIGKNMKEIVYLNDTITTAWQNGYVASPIIGPSFKWNSLYWNVRSIDAQAGDSTYLKVIGITAAGKIDTLLTLWQNLKEIQNLDQQIDAKKYPYLQLVALMKDNIFKTSPQLKYWRVYYDEAPECALNPLKGFKSVNDSLQEGDLVKFNVPVENIGIRDFTDSLVISYWLEDNQKNKINLAENFIPGPFKAGAIFIDTISINSLQLIGHNNVWMHVNPITHPRYQLEQEQFNNVGKFEFQVRKDQTNPLLDVTFDGIRILNGDLVSARPTILISLKDENKFLALNDTSAFNVWITEPGQNSRQRLFFVKELEFTPASLPKNSATIHYRPVLPKDGTYQLTVQARDRSSNVAGRSEYAVQFAIDNKPSITQVLNYPNPFTTSTRFVFTITGSEVPEVFTIQILTITGKVVREITRAELGNLHIGRNITDFAWDGRDMFGDRLANGVYLYRVMTRLNGNKLDLNESGADKFFVKEFGKMVLMR